MLFIFSREFYFLCTLTLNIFSVSNFVYFLIRYLIYLLKLLKIRINDRIWRIDGKYILRIDTLRWNKWLKWWEIVEWKHKFFTMSTFFFFFIRTRKKLDSPPLFQSLNFINMLFLFMTAYSILVFIVNSVPSFLYWFFTNA